MSSVSATGAPAGPPASPEQLPVGDRREMERFGVMLWLALTGSSNGLVPGSGGGFLPEDGSFPRPGSEEAGRDRSADLPPSRPAASRTAVANNLVRGPEAGPASAARSDSPRETARAAERAGGERAARDTSGEASRPGGDRGEGGGTVAQTSSQETGGRGRSAAGDGSRSVGALRGISAAADGGGRGNAAAAYRALAQGVRGTSPVPAQGTAAFTSLLKAQAAKLAGGGRANGTVSIPFQDALGAQGRIRLALRGGILQTTIVSANPETVQKLGAGVGELRSALVEQGFADAHITVREARPQEFAAQRPETREQPREQRDGHPRRRGHDGQDTSSRDGQRHRNPDEEVHRS